MAVYIDSVRFTGYKSDFLDFALEKITICKQGLLLSSWK
jgi:hypothetical protein